MGKKPKQEHWADNRQFASEEEIDFYFWLLEAAQYGIIKSWSYQPKTFLIYPGKKSVRPVRERTRIVEKERTLAQDTEYTPDFLFIATPEFNRLFFDRNIYDVVGNYIGTNYWIDVKGEWSPYNDDDKFKMLQGWLDDKFGIWVNKLVPQKFFEHTFVPLRSAYTPKTKQPRACYLNCPRLAEVLRRQQPELAL